MAELNPKMRLGFGAMRLPLLNPDDPSSIDVETFSRMIDSYLEQGFNYIDTAYPYHKEHSEEAICEALVKRYPRDSYLLADKMPTFLVKGPEDYERFFATQLERCQVEYFDYYLLHNMGKDRFEETTRYGGFEFMKKLKAEGKARHIGFSFHDKPEVLDAILTAHPEMEFVQIQLNYIDWESNIIQSKNCLEVARKHGKPVIVMEPIKGGGLVNLPEEAAKLLKDHDPEASIASWAIRFAASQEGVMMVLSGMSAPDQLADNTSYMKEFRPLSAEELAVLDKVVEILRQSSAIPCTSCKYCVDECPMNINIPGYFSVYNLMKQYGTNNFPQMHYNRQAQGHGAASDCIECHSCESHCPQHIKITEHLKEIASIFEKK